MSDTALFINGQYRNMYEAAQLMYDMFGLDFLRIAHEMYLLERLGRNGPDDIPPIPDQ